MNAFSERWILFTRGSRMATSTRLSVFLSIVLNHVVHVASFKLHYFGFALQLVSPPDIHSLRKRLLYCLLHFLLLCDTLLMTPNHNKTAVQNCGSSWCKRDVLRTRQNKISSLIHCFYCFPFYSTEYDQILRPLG